ncbi:FadR/GntR family transcriptional regulator [Nocardioides yefusunii]|uniref:FadR/GntR family transcriptional regulator n=1 Tax=Nocardioides yefusunii TaxID=2500546 RepID=A0ABW1QU52_9ACTN|nr:FCD domain-containing protein [Nocardioides yefusunii]
MVTAAAHGTSRARQTLRVLQHRIVSGEWPLNSRIPTEKELVEELGVGRSTIREAVRTLANMGMLEPAPSRGTFVRSLTPVSEVLGEFMAGRGVVDLIETRVALEVEAARLAAGRISAKELSALRTSHDDDVASTAGAEAGADLGAGSTTGVERGSTPGQFHALVVRASGSALIADMHAGVMRGLRRAVSRGEARPGIDAASRHADHAALLAALAAGDEDRAAAVARDHVLRDLVPTAGDATDHDA